MKFTQDQREQIRLWFQDRCYDLSTLGTTTDETNYLNHIQEIVHHSGATSLRMAEYFLNIEGLINALTTANVAHEQNIRNLIAIGISD